MPYTMTVTVNITDSFEVDGESILLVTSGSLDALRNYAAHGSILDMFEEAIEKMGKRLIEISQEVDSNE